MASAAAPAPKANMGEPAPRLDARLKVTGEARYPADVAVSNPAYAVLVTSYSLHVLFVPFALLFMILSILYGMLLSQMAVGIETLLLARYPRLRDRVILLLAGLLEFAGYRQVLTWERFIAMFQVRSKRGQWGKMLRTGIPSGPSAPAPEGLSAGSLAVRS